MSKTKLYDLYIGLIPNVITGFVFYIPEKGIPSGFIDEFEELKMYNFFNKVFIFDKYKGPIHYENESKLTGSMSLPVNLDKNMFNLVEIKETVTDREMEFLLNKYSKFLEALVFFSKWMHNNFEGIFANKNKLKIAFKSQLENYTLHQKTLNTTFYSPERRIPKVSIGAKSIVDDIFPDFTRSFSKEKISDFINPSQSNVASLDLKTGLSNSRTVSKKPLINLKDAEKKLLQVYFGINKNI
ncbi:hypothetical protein EVU94_13770 [Flavobacteriaceae bacterium 144Ye]|nr:hypothetical protein EVU94_13770 [Flavobacteriaceae bacterium 144Ye]